MFGCFQVRYIPLHILDHSCMLSSLQSLPFPPVSLGSSRDGPGDNFLCLFFLNRNRKCLKKGHRTYKTNHMSNIFPLHIARRLNKLFVFFQKILKIIYFTIFWQSLRSEKYLKEFFFKIHFTRMFFRTEYSMAYGWP